MSNTDFDQESLSELARLELLQGILQRDIAVRRRQLYNRFGAPEDPWVHRARNTYDAMHQMHGFVASVGDQLAAELDIREHAELYAAVGGFAVSEITYGLGIWWSPSATWFQSGKTLASDAGLADPASEDFDAMSRLLLDAGAHKLATFFATVASGGIRLIGSGGWRWHQQRKQFAFVTEVARTRGLLFRDGPDENGRYLRDEDVRTKDILEAVTRVKSEQRTEDQLISGAVPGGASIMIGVRKPEAERRIQSIQGLDVGGSVSTMRIAIEPEPGVDAEELDQQLRWLREELLDLDVEAVNRVSGVTAPEGAKAPAGDLASTLIIAFSNSAVLAALVGVVRTWLSRGSGRRVKLQIGADSIEIEGQSTADRDKLIEQWIARNAR